MPRNPRAASLPTVRKAGGELTDEARKLNKILGALIKHADFKDADAIYVQDDNAPAHKLSQECVQKVWDKYDKTKPRIIKQTQPPKSPDLNVCDMRVFSWVQQEIDRPG